MKGIIYCRVSSHDQVQGTSLNNQQAACEEYARNKGIEVASIFIERGESATAVSRTEFLKALDYCRDNKDTEAFVVWKVDRFARNTTDHFGVRAKLIQNGTTLHSVTEPLSNDPNGKLMETLLAGFAEFENDTRKARCTAGMQGSLRKGLWIWQSKFGYTRPKKITKRVIECDKLEEPRATLLRKGMELYAEGNTSINDLVRLSKEWGLYSRNNKVLYKQRWSEILEDKYYAGIITDPWTEEEYSGQHEPLISLETFHKIQAVKHQMGRPNQIRIQKHPDFPLRRFVKCSECHHFLTGSKSKGRKEYYSYYHCKKNDCTQYGKTIPKSELELLFIDYLRRLVPKDEYLQLFEVTVLKVWEERMGTVAHEHDLHSNRTNLLEKKLSRIIEMRAEGDLSKDEYKKLRGELDSQIATTKISANETEIERLDLEARLTYAKQYIHNMARIWQDLPIDKQIKMQKVVLPEGVTYNKESGTFGTAPLSYAIKLLSQSPLKESYIVAGPGLEPGSGGYEPPEVPLLHPAIFQRCLGDS